MSGHADRYSQADREKDTMTPAKQALRMSGHADTIRIAQPWLDRRKKWQAILDEAAPGSPVAQQARANLRYIDSQLIRLGGRLT